MTAVHGVAQFIKWLYWSTNVFVCVMNKPLLSDILQEDRIDFI